MYLRMEKERTEADAGQEMRKSRDSVKLARQMERNYKDMEYQYNQERRNYEKMEAGTKFGPILFHFLPTFARI